MDFFLIALSNFQSIELSVHAKGGENFQNITRHTRQWDKCDIFITLLLTQKTAEHYHYLLVI